MAGAMSEPGFEPKGWGWGRQGLVLGLILLATVWWRGQYDGTGLDGAAGGAALAGGAGGDGAPGL